jgi:molecular chaperone HtpG
VDPYRSASREDRAEAPRDPGIVGEVIAQFADPLAFYRELVQNSIDAGTPTVEIAIEHDDGAGVVRVSVRDRGSGMTRDILENQLLVLFRSTKERDDSKIGKFGIGFASVLSPNPDVVVVHSARDGRRLTLHLDRDLTYQLFDAGPATQSGTTVELDIPMRAEQVGELVRNSITALERWCRHASVPIEFTARVPGAEPVAMRIDRPLGLDGALVEAHGTTDDGKLVAVVGVTATADPYTGFFNHGLMLHETVEPLLGCVSVKVQDSRLGHTLSRDNVRRDAHFTRALAFARSLVERELPAVAGTALRSASDAGDATRWWQLVVALDEAKVELPKRAWCFPLVAPMGERRSIDADALGRRAWTSHRGSELASILAKTGVPVLQSDPKARDFLKALVNSVARCELRDVEHELTCVTPITPSDDDIALVAMLNEVLAIAYRAPSEIVLAKLSGAYGTALAITGDPAADRTQPHVVDRDQAVHNPFGRQRLPLVISTEHPLYRGAFADDPRAGAVYLARVMLLQHRLLDVVRSTAILEYSLDQLGVGAKS